MLTLALFFYVEWKNTYIMPFKMIVQIENQSSFLFKKSNALYACVNTSII